jgi:hypothetical protein
MKGGLPWVTQISSTPWSSHGVISARKAGDASKGYLSPLKLMPAFAS